eukprot:25063-Prymnesium_polylepis.1
MRSEDGRIILRVALQRHLRKLCAPVTRPIDEELFRGCFNGGQPRCNGRYVGQRGTCLGHRIDQGKVGHAVLCRAGRCVGGLRL